MVDPGRDVMCTVNYLFPNVHYFLPSVQWEMLGKNKKRNRLPIFLSLGSFAPYFSNTLSVVLKRMMRSRYKKDLLHFVQVDVKT